MTDALSAGQIRADIAELLYVDPGEITDDTDLFESGLDSVRILGLVERWRSAGARADFTDLAEHPTVGAWTALLTGRGAADA